jgi:thiol-disulfide isomerase/thioredoxin
MDWHTHTPTALAPVKCPAPSRALAIASLLLLFLQTAAAAPPADLTIWPEPKTVAEVEFSDSQGKPRTLSDFKGQIVLLNLWATWCGPCREEMPTLDRLQGQLGGADFQVLALSVDPDGEQVVRDFYAEIGIQHLELYIDESARAIGSLGAFGLPATLLLDRHGRELGRKLGAAEWDNPEVIEYLRELIGTPQGG